MRTTKLTGLLPDTHTHKLREIMRGMKLKKSLIGAAIVAALGLASFGANAAQVTVMHVTTGTFTGCVAVNTPWSGDLMMDVDSGLNAITIMIPNAFGYSGGQVSIGSIGTGFHVDDSDLSMVDMTNLAITWSFAPGAIFPIGNENDGGVDTTGLAMQTISGTIGGGAFDLTVTGGSGIGPSTWTMAGTYETTAVPVPAAAWLLGSALVGLVGVARRKEA